MWDRSAAINRIADLLMALALVLAAYGILHVAVRLPAFPLREVRVTNAVVLANPALLKDAIRRVASGNFFTVELDAVRGALLELPWVRNVSLRRRWPDRIEVTIEEHVPLARWGSAGLVNDRGEVFNAAYEGRLPVFIGPAGAAKEMAIQYEFFRRTLAAIGQTPQQVQVTARRAWQIRLENGPTLELGRDEVEMRLARFANAYARSLALLDRRVELVDLRYANGFAVRLPGLRHEKDAPKGRKGTS